MRFKKMLAHQIVTELHGKELANSAQKFFESTVQNKELPDDVEEFFVPLKRVMTHYEALKLASLPFSNTEIKRLAKQNAILFNTNTILNDLNAEYEFSGGEIYQLGKRTYRKVKGR